MNNQTFMVFVIANKGIEMCQAIVISAISTIHREKTEVESAPSNFRFVGCYLIM